MALSDAELLDKVKTGLRVAGSSNDATLMIKTIAVKEFMLNAGVSILELESNLGIATLTIGVSDIWNISSGDIKFSDAFMIVLMPQLMTISIGG